MPTRPVPLSEIQACIDCLARHEGNFRTAAEELGIPRGTLQSRVVGAKRQNLKPGKGIENMEDIHHVKMRLKRTEAELATRRAWLGSLTKPPEPVRAKACPLSLLPLASNRTVQRPAAEDESSGSVAA